VAAFHHVYVRLGSEANHADALVGVNYVVFSYFFLYFDLGFGLNYPCLDYLLYLLPELLVLAFLGSQIVLLQHFEEV
jgi:hypothetical protein